MSRTEHDYDDERDDPEDYRSVNGLAVAPEKGAMPESLSIQRDLSGGVNHKIRGFLPLGGADACVSIVPWPNGELPIQPGWVDGQPVFLITGSLQAVNAIQSLSILAVRAARFLCRSGALFLLDLTLHKFEWPTERWSPRFDLSDPGHISFLYALAAQTEITLLYVPFPAHEYTACQMTYHLIDPVGKQIEDVLYEALEHDDFLGGGDFRATFLNYLRYHLSAEN